MAWQQSFCAMTHRGLAARFGDLSSRARPSVRNDRIAARALASTWVFVLISGGNEHQTGAVTEYKLQRTWKLSDVTPVGDSTLQEIIGTVYHRFIDGASG
ncbi:unnamed protein product [Clonostachys byssicola]|uniref:Uncharacterized protein n=1 Tax=Clonostachys byssicola TaxID=160290 RepID=A0A9N9U5X0_9HYPO|nr:unnamed protein product [Clonostachys byssicola]